MKIDELRIKNFRCFDDFAIHLHPQCNVLIGINGAGKSTVLDALAVALGGYLSGFDDIEGHFIQPQDVHYKMYMAGNRIERQEQFPVEIFAQAMMQDKERHILGWQRELNGKGRKTTYGNAKFIMEYARNLQDKVRSGDAGCILPVVAYYGTGRLWLQKRNRVTHHSDERINRQMGYKDCLAAESNEKRMMQWFEEMTYIQLQEGRSIAELEAVKAALRRCYLSVDDSVTDAKFAYDVKSHELEVSIFREDSGEKFPVRMLSDGEKGMISMVADLAYRMAVLNPGLLGKVLETPGVVLIDEVDLHLHPAWQKRVVKDLMDTFPNVQFVMTTHSPSVLANVPGENIWILDHFQLYQPQTKTYGRTIGEILQEVMDVNVLPNEIKELQSEFDRALDDENYDRAEDILNQMREILGENSRAVIENQIALDMEG